MSVVPTGLPFSVSLANNFKTLVDDTFAAVRLLDGPFLVNLYNHNSLTNQINEESVVPKFRKCKYV